MPLTRWELTAPGICYLQSFSEGFVQLIARERDLLYSCFTCVQMYTVKEFPSTRKFIDLICSGRVDSLSVRIPLLRGTGEVIPVVSMMSIEFSNGIPAHATICMSRIDASDYQEIPFWEPYMVKLLPLSLSLSFPEPFR